MKKTPKKRPKRGDFTEKLKKTTPGREKFLPGFTFSAADIAAMVEKSGMFFGYSIVS